jgi:hypothetical protein
LPGQDSGVFLYSGQRLLAGDIPYVDFWDHKGPLIIYINALGLLLGSGSRWGVWLLEFIFLVFTSIGLYEIARQRWGVVFSGLLLLLWSFFMKRAGSYYHFGDANYIESYGLVFIAWGVVFWLWALNSERRVYWLYFLVGVMAGLSFSLRPNNIAVYLSIVLVDLLASMWKKTYFEHFKRLIFVILGGLSVIIIFLILFWRQDALAQLIDAVLFYNIAYSGKNASAETVLGVLKFGLTKFYWLPVIFFIGIAGKFLYKMLQTEFQISVDSMFTMFLLVWSLFEVSFSVISGRALLHYFINWTPLVSLLAVMFVTSYIPLDRLATEYLPSTKNGRWFFTFLILFLLLTNTSTLTGGWRALRYIWKNQKLEQEKTLIKFIKDTTAPEDEVLVWGNDVWINFLTERQSPSKFSYQYALFMPGYTNREKVLSFLDEISTCPPFYIVEPMVDTDEVLPLSASRRIPVENSKVFPPDEMDQVYAFFDDNYEFVRDINGVNIFTWAGDYDQNIYCKNR